MIGDCKEPAIDEGFNFFHCYCEFFPRPWRASLYYRNSEFEDSKNRRTEVGKKKGEERTLTKV